MNKVISFKLKPIGTYDLVRSFHPESEKSPLTSPLEENYIITVIIGDK